MILTKNRTFIGKGYAKDKMYLLSTINENIMHFSYFNYLNDIWNYRVEDASKKIINRMYSHFNLILKCKINNSIKCEICAQVKLIMERFSSIIKNTIVLELVHIDICNNKELKIRGVRRYFMTFSNDYSKYTYVYFLR